MFICETNCNDMNHSILRTIRKQRNISQIEMAHKLAMDQTTYSRKERGMTKFRKEEWLKIAVILEVAVEDLCDDGTFYHVNSNHHEEDKSNSEEYITVNKFLFDSIVHYVKKLEEENEILKNKTELG